MPNESLLRLYQGAIRLGASRWRWLLLAVLLAAVMAVNGLTADGDLPFFEHYGRLLLAGQWRGIYVDPKVQSGPLQLALAGVLSHIWDLPYGEQAVNVVLTAVVTVGAGQTVRTLRRWSGQARHIPAETLVMAVALAWGLAIPTYVFGHIAEVAIPVLWLCAARAAQQHRPTLAGLFLGAAAGWEIWSILGVVVLLYLPSWRSRFCAAILAGIVSAAWFTPFLTGSFRMLDFTWPVRDGTLLHLVGGASHMTLAMRLTQVLVSVAVAGGVLLGTRGRSDLAWLVAASLITTRLALDGLVYPYYWQPVALLLLVGVVSTPLGWRSRVTIGASLYATTLREVLPQPVLTLGVLALLVAVAAQADTAAPHGRMLTGEPETPLPEALPAT